ncbi:MAG: 16S rRNA (cytosine(967)-C(5))-methyltransferase RsmB [Firmicutes bacterium]|nr:16S rRNA (cytosine(967)-C(5))-methyltransferase RsmB [Bacillota bacterium]
MKSTREIGSEILFGILEEGAYANLLLNKALPGLSEQRDRAFVTNLVYGTLHHLTPIDFQITQFLQKPIKKKDALLYTLLRAAFFEILYSGAKPHAVVNEYVNLGKKKGNIGWGKMLNGVLRNLLRKKDTLIWPDFTDLAESAAFYHSVPLWLMELWKNEYGMDTAVKLIENMDAERFPVIRVNTLKTDRDTLKVKLAEHGVDTEYGQLSKDALRTAKGADLKYLPVEIQELFTVQEESSQLVAYVLDPSEHSLVLDICAAPGGKTTHIAQLMNNTGKVYASDLYDHKVNLIRQNAERLGLLNVIAEKKDGVRWGEDCPEKFDYVLLDAPCSGFGVLNRRSDSTLRKKAEDTENLSAIQKELLDSAYKALKPGGAMVYSTCTLSYAENLGNVKWFLEKYNDMKSSSFAERVTGLTKSEQNQAEAGYLELLPFEHQTDGFFIARFVKDER